MVKLKLQRIGKKKEPHFRLIVQESEKSPHDKSVEILGWLNPRTKERQIKKERVEYWLSVGAQCTDTVHNLLVSEKIIKDKKRKSFTISKKRKDKKEKPKDKIKEEKKEESEKEEIKEDKKVETKSEDKPEEKKESKAEEVKEEKSKEEKYEDKSEDKKE